MTPLTPDLNSVFSGNNAGQKLKMGAKKKAALGTG